MVVLSVFISAQLVTAQSYNFEWAKGFMGFGANAQQELMLSCVSEAVDTDANGNVYSTGYFQGTISFDPNVFQGSNIASNGSYDIYVSKLDAAGNNVWVRRIGGTQADQSRSLVVDGLGNVIVAGTFTGTVDFDPGSGIVNLTSAGGNDGFILKLDSNGNFIWVVQVGGTGNDTMLGLATDVSGNLYSTGGFASPTVDFDPGTGVFNLTSSGGYDSFVQKLDASGNFVWAKAVEGSNDAAGWAVAVDGGGNVYTGGLFNGTVDLDPSSSVTISATSAGGYDGYIQKLTSNGDYVWAQHMQCTQNFFIRDILVNGLNQTYVTGEFQGTADFDPGTNVLSITSAGNEDAFVQKLNANGGLEWVNQIGGTGQDFGQALELDGAANVYSVGTFSSTVDFDASSATFNLTSNGNLDCFHQKIDANGNLIWAYGIGGNSNDNVVDVALDNANNILTTGTWIENPDFDPTPGFQNIAYAVVESAYVKKMSQGACSNTFGTDVQTTCDSLTWIDGNTYTASNNSATFTLQNAAGCDSIVTLDLTVTNSSVGTDTQIACGSYTWIDGNTYTASNNTATYILPNAAGCDSIVTLDLTVSTVNVSTSIMDLTITANAQGAAYQWIDCDNNNAPISGETGQSFTATSNGNYAVIVTENNCSDTSACASITTVGVEEIGWGVDFVVHPNPTNGDITLSFTDIQQDAHIEVRDVQGRLTSSKKCSNVNQVPIELGTAKGVYFVSVRLKGQVHIERVVKK